CNCIAPAPANWIRRLRVRSTIAMLLRMDNLPGIPAAAEPSINRGCLRVRLLIPLEILVGDGPSKGRAIHRQNPAQKIFSTTRLESTEWLVEVGRPGFWAP